MDTTQVKSDFNGFGPLSNAKTTASVGYQDAFAPMSTSVGVPPPKNIPSKIQLYSSNPARSVSQKFEVNVDYHQNKSTLALGDDGTGSPIITMESDSNTDNANITLFKDADNVTFMDCGVVEVVADGKRCPIDPSVLPSDAGFILITTTSGNYWVLGCPA